MGQGPEAVLGVGVDGDVELRGAVGGAELPFVDPGLGSYGGALRAAGQVEALTAAAMRGGW